MKIKNYAISFTMIALLVLMQFVSPFLHSHISDSSHAASSYEMHFHGDSDHDDDTNATTSVVHFEAIASYVSPTKYTAIKSIALKKAEPVNLMQDIFKFIADSPPKLRPPHKSTVLIEPISIGFMALAPPVA